VQAFYVPISKHQSIFPKLMLRTTRKKDRWQDKPTSGPSSELYELGEALSTEVYYNAPIRLSAEIDI
jgi:hypothetical protein